MQCTDAYATNSERQVPKMKQHTHLLELFVFWMERAWDVVHADLALSALCAVEILSQVI